LDKAVLLSTLRRAAARNFSVALELPDANRGGHRYQEESMSIYFVSPLIGSTFIAVIWMAADILVRRRRDG
jgi:hypothetical protein